MHCSEILGILEPAPSGKRIGGVSGINEGYRKIHEEFHLIIIRKKNGLCQ
jgi:hypothetical protein